MHATGKWAKRAVWLTLAAVMTIGCNPLQTAAFIFQGDKKEAARYPLRPKEGDKHKKDEELKVLVICEQRAGLPMEFAGADRELASILANKLPELAKENKEKITVISASELDEFKMKRPGALRTMKLSDVGKALGADVVIDIHLGQVSLYQPGSLNKLYDGRAELQVDVYTVADGKKKYSYPYPYAYHPNHTPDATEVSLASYRMGFLDRLASEIAWRHMDHLPGDAIASPQ